MSSSLLLPAPYILFECCFLAIHSLRMLLLFVKFECWFSLSNLNVGWNLLSTSTIWFLTETYCQFLFVSSSFQARYCCTKTLNFLRTCWLCNLHIDWNLLSTSTCCIFFFSGMLLLYETLNLFSTHADFATLFNLHLLPESVPKFHLWKNSHLIKSLKKRIWFLTESCCQLLLVLFRLVTVVYEALYFFSTPPDFPISKQPSSLATQLQKCYIKSLKIALVVIWEDFIVKK